MPDNSQRKSTIWEKLLAIAVHAPSPHNAQPWRLRILDGRQATLYVERARMMPDLDTTGHFIRSSMSMFIEALTIVSANSGLALRYNYWMGTGRHRLCHLRNSNFSRGH